MQRTGLPRPCTCQLRLQDKEWINNKVSAHVV
jgi:hypothetical protein